MEKYITLLGNVYGYIVQKGMSHVDIMIVLGFFFFFLFLKICDIY